MNKFHNVEEVAGEIISNDAYDLNKEALIKAHLAKHPSAEKELLIAYFNEHPSSYLEWQDWLNGKEV